MSSDIFRFLNCSCRGLWTSQNDEILPTLSLFQCNINGNTLKFQNTKSYGVASLILTLLKCGGKFSPVPDFIFWHFNLGPLTLHWNKLSVGRTSVSLLVHNSQQEQRQKREKIIIQMSGDEKIGSRLKNSGYILFFTDFWAQFCLYLKR